MTVPGDQAISLLADTLRTAWWVPRGTDTHAGLRRAALTVFADALTPTRRFLRLLDEGAFGEAERLLTGCEADLLGLTAAGDRLAAARENALKQTIGQINSLRRRSERLGRVFDQDLATLLVSMAEDDERDVLAELAELADSIAKAETETATTLIAAGGHLDKEQSNRLRDLVDERQWDAARLLLDHGTAVSAMGDSPATPPLARLGVAPAALFRSFAKGHNPGRATDGWREVDAALIEVISRIPETGPAPALAAALRCTATLDDDVTTLHSLFDGTRAQTVAVTDVRLRSTEGVDELAVALVGFATQGRLSLERALQVLLSPGDRAWQLLRAVVDGWSATEILGLTRPTASAIDRIEVVLDLVLRSPQAGLAAVVAHRSGFNLSLAEPLLAVLVPVARQNGRLTGNDIDHASLGPELISAWQQVFTELADEHRDAYLLLAEAASNVVTTADDDLLALLADAAGVPEPGAAVRDLEAAGLAGRTEDSETILRIEPLRVALDAGRGASSVHEDDPGPI